MAKPLRSDEPNPPSVQFRDFGVLDTGRRSKGAAAASIAINVTLAALVVILGIVIKTNPAVAKEVAVLTLPPPPPPEKPVPKPPPIKIKPVPPTPVPPPKIKLPPPPPIPPPPDVKPLPTPQPVKPVFTPPAPPKAVTPPPAPVKVNLGVASAASVPNHDLHPSAVRLGAADNPLKSLTGPAVSSVNLGNAGMPGMNKGNTGNGPPAAAVNLGSGSPDGKIGGRDNAAAPVRGVALGYGTGPVGNKVYAAVKPVQLGAPPPAAPERPINGPASISAATPPKITFKPEPVYTQEAKDHHIEGDAVVKVVFRANGSIDVIGLVRGLGYGLDEPALQVARAIRFRPALNAAAEPVDFPTNVIIHFVVNN